MIIPVDKKRGRSRPRRMLSTLNKKMSLIIKRIPTAIRTGKVSYHGSRAG